MLLRKYLQQAAARCSFSRCKEVVGLRQVGSPQGNTRHSVGCTRQQQQGPGTSVCVCVCVCVSRAQLACCHKPMNANALTQPHIQSRGSNNSNPSRPNSFTQQPTQAYSQEDRSLESHQRAALRPSRVKVGTQFRGCASCAFYFACAAVHTATHSTGCEECVRTFARAVSNCLALYATVPASLASAAFALFS
jgi:hypothetical protein